MTFDQALQRVLRHEGGYVNDPADPGGETNFGITKAVAIQHGYAGQMKAIPMDMVAKIYRASYWDRVRADELPAALRYPMFDAAVNSGAGQAVRWLQRALGVTVDGLIGPATIAAARHGAAAAIAARISGQRLAMLAGLKHFDRFGRGWTLRVASILSETPDAVS